VNNAKSAQSVHIRIVVVAPPPGVQFAVQRGRSALLAPSAASHERIRFDLSLRVGPARPEESVNFVGEFAQGPPSDRFIYLNSGTLAGQADSCWTRRAKLKLASIPQPLVETALATPQVIIEARVAGTMRDGGPICASVKSQDVVWSVVRDAATEPG
jgi:hypothetical protein